MSMDLTTFGLGAYEWADMADWGFGVNPLVGFPPPVYRDNFKRGEALPFYLDEYQ